MANLSDAYGTITVKKVGKEFLEYARVAAKAYWNLCGFEQDLPREADKDGNIEFEFSTAGRWSYDATLEGYLSIDGSWHQEGMEAIAYKRLIEAIDRTGGEVMINYNDSDSAMGWRVYGRAILATRNGKVHFVSDFQEE